MEDWQAWLALVVLFGVPSALLWRWRHLPSKPEARKDLEEALEFAQRKGSRASEQLELDQWRSTGRFW